MSVSRATQSRSYVKICGIHLFASNCVYRIRQNWTITVQRMERSIRWHYFRFPCGKKRLTDSFSIGFHSVWLCTCILQGARNSLLWKYVNNHPFFSTFQVNNVVHYYSTLLKHLHSIWFCVYGSWKLWEIFSTNFSIVELLTAIVLVKLWEYSHLSDVSYW